MATIPLTRGLVAVIDDADEADLSAFRWHAANLNGFFYAARTRREDRRVELMHRRIMDPAPTGREVDHVNGDTLDNCRSNLRFATKAEQQQNRHSITGRSRYKGVSWDGERGRWTAHITAGGRHIRIGRFHDEEDAARAYDAAAREHFGQFARVNL